MFKKFLSTQAFLKEIQIAYVHICIFLQNDFKACKNSFIKSRIITFTQQSCLFLLTRIIIIMMVVATRTTLITGTIIATRFVLPWPVSFLGEPKNKCKLYRFAICFKINQSPRLLHSIHP